MHKHYVIGTAGHIDHGKTTLSKALTGVDTDRLKEEKERSISIELGFAPFSLPNGDQVSLIDVPGHEKFVHHMVAGIGGIDLVLFVIAADEGIMPQTQEHLQIIELLGIHSGIVVITKKDLVEPDFLNYVEEEIMSFLKGTILEKAPVLAVSSTTYEGIDELKLLIQNKLSQMTERESSGFFKMPIDRVFTLKGIGTVVTGTAYSGKVNVGDELEILPSNHKVRVRSLQVHSKGVEQAFAGQRIAMNLAKIELSDLQRGESIVTPDQWRPSHRIDVELNILKDIDFSIKQHSELKLLIGTTEVLGSLILYDRKEILPGETVYAQIKLREPIISSRKERFIIRRPSPSITIGGGVIIEPNAERHKYRTQTVEQLIQRSKGTLEDLLLEQFHGQNKRFLNSKELSNLLILPEDEIIKSIHKLKERKALMEFGQGETLIYTPQKSFNDLKQQIADYLRDFHQKYPSRTGELKAEFLKHFMPNIKLKFTQEVIRDLEQKQWIKVNDEYISNFEFQPSLPLKLKEKADKLEQKLIEQGLAPDEWDLLTKEFDIKNQEKNELYTFLLNQNQIYKLTDKIIIHRNALEQLKQIVTDFLRREEQMTLQQAKEILQVSRKFLVPMMELLDQEKITTLKEGNQYRVLRN